MLYWHALLDMEALSKHACHEPSWIEARNMLLTFGHISTGGRGGKKKKKSILISFLETL